MFAEPPPVLPDCWAQGELLTALRLHGLGSVWCWACLALMSAGADDFPDVVTRVKGLGTLIVPVLGLKCGAGREKGVSPFQGGFPAEEDGLRALSLPWLLAAPAPLALLFLGTLMCSSLVPSCAEQHLGEEWEWEFLPCSPSHPSTALPAVLPLIFAPSLPSPPKSARSRGRKRGLLPDGSKCSICNTLSEEITAQSLSLIKQPGQILHEPAGQPHPHHRSRGHGEDDGRGRLGWARDWAGPSSSWVGVLLDPPGLILCGASSCSLLPMGIRGVWR